MLRSSWISIFIQFWTIRRSAYCDETWWRSCQLSGHRLGSPQGWNLYFSGQEWVDGSRLQSLRSSYHCDLLTVAAGLPVHNGYAVDFIEAVAGVGPEMPLRLLQLRLEQFVILVNILSTPRMNS